MYVVRSDTQREAVLVELRLEQAERQPRRDDLLHRHLAQEVRKAADVILVAVRDDHREDVVAALEVRDVGQDEVDAEVLVARINSYINYLKKSKQSDD